jgi:hypothetical protein
VSRSSSEREIAALAAEILGEEPPAKVVAVLAAQVQAGKTTMPDVVVLFGALRQVERMVERAVTQASWRCPRQ